MKSRKILSVFISSPSDVSEERDLAEAAIENINKIKANSLGFQLEAIKWENDIIPVFGDEPQNIIDDQIGENYDIFIGIMSTRFGTPTSKAESGTQHEFEQALERKQRAPSSLEILFYFQEPGHSQRKIVAKELEKIEVFKETIKDQGIRTPYLTPTDFQTKVSAHLSKLIDKFASSDGSQEPSENSSNQEPTVVENNNSGSEISTKLNSLSDPLSFLEELDEVEDEIEEFGYLDAADEAFEGFSKASEMLETLTASMNKMTSEIDEHANELNSPIVQQAPGVQKKILSKSSVTMGAFVETCRAILPLMQKHLAEGIDGSRNLVIMLPEGDESLIEPRNELRGNLLSLKEGIQHSVGQFENLSVTLGSLPRASKEFNTARKRTKAVIDGISRMNLSAVQQLDEIIQILS